LNARTPLSNKTAIEISPSIPPVGLGILFLDRGDLGADRRRGQVERASVQGIDARSDQKRSDEEGSASGEQVTSVEQENADDAESGHEVSCHRCPADRGPCRRRTVQTKNTDPRKAPVAMIALPQLARTL
jgi:hypothetical protein